MPDPRSSYRVQDKAKQRVDPRIIGQCSMSCFMPQAPQTGEGDALPEEIKDPYYPRCSSDQRLVETLAWKIYW